ncbi:MAG: molybdopterin molybdotransferase MoeA [Chloroflexi bacterium]|nr:molybdopterin molybdotransferase MoeA [Chloroflexota bacterium]MQC25335.1 molybdopterin molybdenumtransferase MoeA [Chloroflexota bacterium]MQC47463.1 molybdopterin molybdenumtransferase MoeA [Chloroflexota bacterium]
MTAGEEQSYSATKTGNRDILPADMISVEDARARILERFEVLPPVDVPLLEAQGLVLAEDVRATINIPPLANTGMDGYALQAGDTAGATYDSPKTLKVIGYLAAGTVFDGVVGPGEAVRIMTGAPIPAGADAVVPFEETDEYDWATRESAREAGSWQESPRDTVRIDVEAKPAANVRNAGEDVREGDLVLPAGTVVGPAQTGILASLGIDSVRVHRRPVVAILSTGDELLRPGEPPEPGKIYDANAFGLAAVVRALGGEPVILDVARDTVDALTARIHEGLARADMLVTSAGVSRGDFDVVKTVLSQEGEIGFWTVNMKPGKPLAFGAFRSPAGPDGGDGRTVPHLGLPGNPVSAMVTFELFGRPAVFKMLGKLQAHPDAWERPTVRAVARERITNSDGRRFYARCIATQDAEGSWEVRLTGPQGSGVLTSIAYANAYAILPEGESAIEVGQECVTILVDREAPVPPPARG